MGQTIQNRDAGSSGLTVQSQPDGNTTDCHGLAVTLTATSGRASALYAYSQNPAAPAAVVQGPGTLIDLRNAAGVSAFSVSQSGAVTAGGAVIGGSSQPWVFDVTTTTYGARGDGKVVTDGAMTAGSTTLTCVSAPFTPTDVGKAIMVKGAGPAGVTTLVATISAYTSSSVVTLSVAASTTVSGALVMWGTDDTTAIQTAINAAHAYAVLHGAATVFFPPPTQRFYAIAGALVTGGTTKGNAQLTIPIVASTTFKPVLTFQGAGDGSGVQHWEQLVPQLSGSPLVSFKVHASSSAQTASINAAGNSCVLGGPSQPGGYGVSPGVFSNMNVVIRDLSILTTHSANGLTLTAVDLSGVANAGLHNVAYGTAGTVPGTDYTNPNGFANGLAVGLLLPASGNNDNVVVQNISCHGGYTYAIFATEHADINNMRILYCWAAFCPVGTYYGSVGSTHAIVATLLSIENCTYLVYVIGQGSSGLGPFLHLRIDTETSTPRFGGNSSGAGLTTARGDVVLTGLYTAGNLTLDAPVGFDIIDGQKPYPATTVAADYTAGAFDELIVVNATAAARTITLPTAVGRTRRIVIVKSDSSVNAVTADGAGAETINGATTKATSTQWGAMELLPVGGNWVAI